MLKGLNQFRSFDAQRFFKDKTLEVVSIKKWIDYGTKNILGEKVEVVILEDKTNYDLSKNGDQITNKFEKFNVKVSDANNIMPGNRVVLINPNVSVFGEFQNQISVTADGLKILKEV